MSRYAIFIDLKTKQNKEETMNKTEYNAERKSKWKKKMYFDGISTISISNIINPCTLTFIIGPLIEFKKKNTVENINVDLTLNDST